MKKVLPLLVLVGACAPDIAQEGQPPKAVSVVFDLNKKAVPLPNDLAKDPTTGKIVVPDESLKGTPFDTDAQKEFNHDYLGQLDGFPFESTASVTFDGDLKPETVTPANVKVIDITNPAAPAPVDGVTPTYVAAAKTITLAPPNGAWTRGHTYAVALVAGEAGLRGANGEDVIGSSSWALVSGKTPLISCVDPKNLDSCTLNVDVIPSTKSDPKEKLNEEKTTALQLEQIRQGYDKILTGLGAAGIDRAKIPQVWTFSIIDSGEVTFDPANSTIPFPNDVLRDPSTGKVKLPNPKTGKPLADADCAAPTDTQVQLACALNTLDGFSTIAAPISENSDKGGAVAQATVNGASLTAASVGLAPMKSDAPKAIQTKPMYTPCLNCLSSKDANGNPQTSPQQLQLKLDAPLDEKTTYAAWVTTDVKDDKGRNVIPNPVFAFTRSFAPLVVNGHSAISLLTDDQANQLELLRLAYKPMFDVLETGALTGGTPTHRANLALAWPFTTQSESTLLDKLRDYPSQIPNLPDTPLAAIQEITGLFGAAPGAGTFRVWGGVIVTPVAVTGPGGTLNPTNPLIQVIPFTLSVPVATAPATGWPVTIFGHGFTSSRNAIAAFMGSATAAGQATLSIDVIFHGDRTSCTGAKAAIPNAPSDDYACADPNTMKCDEGKVFGLCVLKSGTRAACTPGPQGDGACLAQGQGKCAADSQCQGAGAGFLTDSIGNPKISGWNLLNPAALFGTRDNLRQSVIDYSQLVRVIKSTATGNLGVQVQAAVPSMTPVLNPAKINYIGQSLGGIQGVLFNSVSPDTHNVVLNVPGGTWSSILLNTISFKPLVDPFLQGLAAQGIVPGTPTFDQFIGVAQWVLDPADPSNMAYRVAHSTDSAGVIAPPADRNVFIQFIEGDQAVPNVSTFALMQAANRSFAPVPPRFNCTAPLYCYEFTEKGDNFDATTATGDTRHPFLLKPPTGTMGAPLTGKAQSQAAQFLATGVLP